MPCTTTCSVLSGVRETFWILAMVPVSYICPGRGSSTFASGIPTRPMRRFPCRASSIKRIERGIPIARGITENGYAKVLRKGKMGRSLGMLVRRVVCSSGCIKLGIFLHPLLIYRPYFRRLHDDSCVVISTVLRHAMAQPRVGRAMQWAAQLEAYVRYPLPKGEGANLVIPWHSHHAFQRPPCSVHDVFLHRNGEHILGEGAMHRVEVNHLHIGTMQAAPDTAVGGDKLAIRVTLLHLVDNAVLGRNDEGFGVGIFRNAAYHRRG